VFLNERFVRLHDTKNGETRDVPLSTRAVEILKNLPRHESGRVFPTTGEALKRVFMRACKRAGIENLHFHDLRHEATSRIAERLDNILELSAVTGHRSVHMLKIYYNPRASDLAKKLGLQFCGNRRDWAGIRTLPYAPYTAHTPEHTIRSTQLNSETRDSSRSDIAQR